MGSFRRISGRNCPRAKPMMNGAMPTHDQAATGGYRYTRASSSTAATAAAAMLPPSPVTEPRTNAPISDTMPTLTRRDLQKSPMAPVAVPTRSAAV